MEKQTSNAGGQPEKSGDIADGTDAPTDENVENTQDGDTKDEEKSSVVLGAEIFEDDEIPKPRARRDSDPLKPNDVRKFKGWKRFLGMGLAIMSSMFFSLAIAFTKVLNQKHGNKNEILILWRFGGGVLLPSICICLYYRYVQKLNIWESIERPCSRTKFKIAFFLFLRAVVGLTTIFFQLQSIMYMELSDSTVIVNSTPVFVTLIAWALLGEKCSIVNVLSAIVTIIGVMIITKPTFITGKSTKDGETTATGSVWALGSMFSLAIVFILLRLLQGVHYSIQIFFLGLYATAISIVINAIPTETSEHSFSLPENAMEWVYTFAMNFSTLFGQLTGTLAFKFEEAGPIALCRSFDVIFSFIWQFIFFHKYPDMFSILGTFVVMCGVFAVGIRKYMAALPEENRCRQKFSCFLK